MVLVDIMPLVSEIRRVKSSPFHGCLLFVRTPENRSWQPEKSPKSSDLRCHKYNYSAASNDANSSQNNRFDVRTFSNGFQNKRTC